MKEYLGVEGYPCDECKRTKDREGCWKHCVRYKKWFCRVWFKVTEKLKRK